MSTIPEILPCPECGQLPQIQSETPEGRLQPVFRVSCQCGKGPLQWSVTEAAAIRLWNRTIGEKKDD
ncbi:MAG: serine acetyltransferase [Desulfovibrio sp.]|nr:serine acetyltransferase [Desulfovibrio sp.]